MWFRPLWARVVVEGWTMRVGDLGDEAEALNFKDNIWHPPRTGPDCADGARHNGATSRSARKKSGFKLIISGGYIPPEAKR